MNIKISVNFFFQQYNFLVVLIIQTLSPLLKEGIFL